jgi:hypothetical protein
MRKVRKPTQLEAETRLSPLAERAFKSWCKRKKFKFSSSWEEWVAWWAFLAGRDSMDRTKRVAKS